MGGRLKVGEFSCVRQHVSQHAIGLEGTDRTKRKYADDMTIILSDSDKEGCARIAQEGNAHANGGRGNLITPLRTRY